MESGIYGGVFGAGNGLLESIGITGEEVAGAGEAVVGVAVVGVVAVVGDCVV